MTPEQLDALRGHTPGPWVYVETLSSCYVKAGHYTERVKEIVNYSYSLSSTIDSANAKLIAAAPDLLAHIDEQQRKIDRLQEAMRNIVANDESDKYSKWPDTQYRMRSIAEAALKEAQDEHMA